MGSWFSCCCGKDEAQILYDEALEAWESYSRTQRQDELEKAISFHRRALELRPAGHADRGSSLIGLTFALLEKCKIEEHTKRGEALLAEVKSYCEEATALSTPPPPKQLYSIHIDLGNVYLSRYRKSGKQNAADLDECIAKYLKALKYTKSNQDRISAFINLSSAYLQRNDLESLGAAIGYLREARGLCSKEEPKYLMRVLSRLANACDTRYYITFDDSDLKEEIEASETALPLQNEKRSRARLLINLSNAIGKLAESQPGEIEKAIGYGREAVALTKDDEELRDMKFQAITALANALVPQNSGTEDVKADQLDEAIEYYRQVIDAGTSDDPEILSSLANAICLRCENGGPVREDEITYEVAIALYEKSLELCNDSVLKANTANNLASIYINRFNRSEREEDLRDAIRYYHQAEKECPDGSEEKSYYQGRIKEGEAELHIQRSSAGRTVPQRTSTLVSRRRTLVRRGSLPPEATTPDRETL